MVVVLCARFADAGRGKFVRDINKMAIRYWPVRARDAFAAAASNAGDVMMLLFCNVVSDS